MTILTKKEKKDFFLIVLLNTVIALADILSLVLLLVIVNWYLKPSGSLIPLLPADNQSPLLVIIFLLLFSAKNIIAFFVQRFQFRYAFAVATRLSENGLSHYYNSDFSHHNLTDSSIYIKKIGQWPVEFSLYVLAGLHQMISQILLVVFAVAGILFFNAQLFISLFILLLPPLVLAAYISKKHLKKAKINTKTNSEKAQQNLQEALNGYVETNVYNSHRFFISRYRAFQHSLNTDLASLQVIQAVPSRLMEIFAVLGLFILVIIARWSGTLDHDYIITISAFLGAAYKIIPGIVKIINISGQISAYTFAVEDILQVQNQSAFKKEKKVTPGIHSIQLKNIHFNYDRQVIINNFSLELEKGDFLILTGESGKGKTTVLNIMTGFLSPAFGEIRINNLPAGKEELLNYRSRLSYVKQQPFFIHDTLLRNIILDDDYNMEKLKCAIEMSGLNTLIETSPNGLTKIITENGKNISGGQRQRIAIARALYKTADLIVLDEPFTELDEQSEWELLNNLKTLSDAGKIVVLVTHNRNSLSFCNKTISLDAK